MTQANPVPDARSAGNLSASNSLFGFPFILKNICSCFIDASHKDQLNLALSCKGMNNFALDILWNKMTSIVPLLVALQCQPASGVTVSDGTGELILTSKPGEFAWLRFLSYAARIKELEFTKELCQSDVQKVPAPTILRLAQLCGEKLLFQNLHTLRVLQVPSVIPSLSIFLSPSLRTVEIDSVDQIQEYAIHSFIGTLSETAPMLQCLSLREIASSTVTWSILRFQFLERVSLGTKVPPALPWIACLGRLRHLKDIKIAVAHNQDSGLEAETTTNATAIASPPELHAHAGVASGVDDALLPGPPETEQWPPFRPLMEVNISGPVDLIHDLLGAVSSTRLESISLQTWGRQCTQHKAKLHSVKARREQAGAQARARNTLRLVSSWCISLTTLILDGVLVDCGITTQYYAESLSKMTQLQHLYINSWGIPDSEVDLFVQDLARNLRHLRRLLLPLSSDNADAAIKFTTLRVLAESCPNLSWLQVPIKTSTVHSLSPQSDSPMAHRLRTLVTGEWSNATASNISQLMPVVRYLNALFPDLCSVAGTGSNWVEVNAVLRTLQDIRRDDDIRRRNLTQA